MIHKRDQFCFQFNYSDDEDELVNKDALCDDLIFRKHLRAEMSGNKKPTPPPGPKPSGTVKYLIPRLRYIIMKQKYNSDYANATIINVTRDADLQNPDNFLKVTHNGKIMYVNKSFKGLEEKTEEYEFKDKKKAKDHCGKVYLTPGQSLSKKALNKPFASDCEKIAEDVKPGDMLQENIEPYEMVKVETTSKGRPVLSKQGRWIRNRSVDNSFYSLKPGTFCSHIICGVVFIMFLGTIDVLRKLEEKLKQQMNERKRIDSRKMINADMGAILEQLEESQKKREQKKREKNAPSTSK